MPFQSLQPGARYEKCDHCSGDLRHAAFARVVRSVVMTVRGMEYVEAARAVDATDLRIIMTHILPNALAPILVQTTLSVANAIMQTASLSFLGLVSRHRFLSGEP